MMGNEENNIVGRATMLIGVEADSTDIDGLEHILSDDMVFKNMVEMANNNPRPNGVTVYDYILGVAYVSYLMNGYDTINAYSFAVGVNLLNMDDADIDELEKKARNLDSRKFIIEMKKVVIAPIYIRYQYLVDDAINTAVTLMNKAKSEKVRLESATLLLNKLTIPEEARLKIEQNISSTIMLDRDDKSAINKLNSVLDNISKGMRDMGKTKPLEISTFDLLPKESNTDDQ